MNDTTQRTGMAGFLRENWLYIVAPFALIVAALILLACFSSDPGSTFIYNIF